MREQGEDDLIAFKVHEGPLKDFESRSLHDLSSSGILALRVYIETLDLDFQLFC